MAIARAARLGVLFWLLAIAVAMAVSAQSADPLREAYDAGMRAYRADDLEAAARHFERALALARERYGEGDPRLATDLNNLAEVYRLLGGLEEAEKLYLEALSLDRQRGSADPGATATTLNNLALLYRAKKRFEEAEDLYRQALQLLEGNLGPNHPDLARLLNNWAMLKLARGEPQAALELERRALELARRGLPADHPQIRVLEQNIERIRSAVARGAFDGGQQRTVRSPQSAGIPVAGYAVHLASMTSEGAARAAARELKQRHDFLRPLDPLPPQPVQIAGKGTFWRVLFGPFADRREASGLCARARAQGLDCFVRELGAGPGSRDG